MSWLDGFRCKEKVDDNGKPKLKVYGVDFGDAGRGLDVLDSAGDFRLCRQKGHTAWSSRGQTAYYATHYYVFHLTEPNDNGIRQIASVLFDEDTKDKNWREVLARARGVMVRNYHVCLAFDKPSPLFEHVETESVVAEFVGLEHLIKEGYAGMNEHPPRTFPEILKDLGIEIPSRVSGSWREALRYLGD